MDDKPKILIVDDELTNLKVLNECLRKEYDVFAVKNGMQALDVVFSDSKPDLILLDIYMPEMDGYEFISQLKENPETENIPVIFLTAALSEEDEEKCFKMGAVDFIKKPSNPVIVVARVKTHITLSLIVKDLQKALKEVKTLSGLLPICMHCKKIRDDKGYWDQIENYIQKHSGAQFSHSICKDCLKKYYSDLDIDE